MDLVVTAHVLDDVVAVAAEEYVVAESAVETVIAAVAVEGVVAVARDDDVVTRRAAEDNVVVARILQIVRVRAGRAWIVADDQRNLDAVDFDTAGRIGIAIDEVGADYVVRRALNAIGTCFVEASMLLRRVDLEGPGWSGEDRVRRDASRRC